MWQDITHNLQAELTGLRGTFSFAPAWAASLLVVVVALAVAWLLHAAILVSLRRLLRGRPSYFRTILTRPRIPPDWLSLSSRLPSAC